MNPEQTPQDNKAGRLAFAYCKIATFSLLAGHYALHVAAFLSDSFFVIGYFQGKKDTKCYLKSPLLAAGFWILILVLWVFAKVFPGVVPNVLSRYYF